MKKTLMLLTTVFAVTACKTTLPELSGGLERGPISQMIWGKNETNKESFSDDVIAEVSAKSPAAKYPNAYNEGYNWGYFFTAYRKMSKYFSYEHSATDLMRIYYPDIYKKYRNDEFELASQRNDAVMKIKQRTDEFDENRVHIMYTNWDFGKYDFGNEEFPLDSLTPTARYRFKQNRVRMPSNSFPYEFSLYFTNPEIIGNLKMPPEEAKVFLQTKKRSSGSVNRKLPVIFYFKLVRLDEGKNSFYAEILDGEVYYGKKDNRVVKTF